MGIAGSLAQHRAQPEPAIGGIGAGLQLAVVEDQRFRFLVLEIEFAVVGVLERIGDDSFDLGFRDVELACERILHGDVHFLLRRLRCI
jgi:hypothetical protein